MNRRDFLAGAGATAAFSMFGARGVRASAAAPITVAATGDCILSRRVSHLTDPGFLRVVQLLRSADCAYGNCELVMASSEPGYPTAAGASLSVIVDPKMADELAWLGYDVMGTANNHSTDYGVEGIRSTIANLERVGIGHAGTVRRFGAEVFMVRMIYGLFGFVHAAIRKGCIPPWGTQRKLPPRGI